MYRIMNIALSKGKGGLEQVAIDYDFLINSLNYNCLNVVTKKSHISLNVKEFVTLPNLFLYDLLSIFKLMLQIQRFKPHFIIAQGGRAIQFARFAKPKHIPLIGVAHCYKLKYLYYCNYIFTIAENQKIDFIKRGITPSKVLCLPNFLQNIPEFNYKPRGKTVIFGTLGRFVYKKGFDVLLEATAILKTKGYNFKLLLGGGGPEEQAYRDISKKLQIEDIVTFTGWVDDKAKFFKKIDIMCMPSLHEPFGIVLLEAMSFSKPIISTAVEGPCDILQEGCGILCNPNSAFALAESMEKLLLDASLCEILAKKAYERLQKEYSLEVTKEKFKSHLEYILCNSSTQQN